MKFDASSFSNECAHEKATGAMDEKDLQKSGQSENQFTATPITPEIPSTFAVSAGLPSTIDAPAKPHSNDPTFPKIEGYVIAGEIARGGMGRVYEAFDVTLKRRVAIKTLLNGSDPSRFINESQITAGLSHPGIPPVHALGQTGDGTPFLAMKLIEGRTLEAILRERSSPTQELPRFIQIFQQIAQAVGFAHSQGIIHRDLKPLNVMVGSFGEVQVMDWGLAKNRNQKEVLPAPVSKETQQLELTALGDVMGTPGFMAPEQARGEAVDERADVFALGATLATILTGRPAFVGTTVRDSIERAARGDVAEVMERLDRAQADLELIRVAKQCLAAKPEERPADARIVADQILAYRDGVEQRLRAAEVATSEARVRESEMRKRRRVWLGLATTLAAGTIVSTSLAIWANSARQAEEKAKTKAQSLQVRAEDGEKLAQTRLVQVTAEKDRAETQRKIAVAVRSFFQNKLLRLADVSTQADELIGMGASAGLAYPNPTIRELLDRAYPELLPDRIEENFPGQYEIQGELLYTAGNAFRAVGGFDNAIDLLKRSAELRSKSLGPNAPETHASLNNLGDCYREAGKFAEAISILRSLQEAQIALKIPVNQKVLSTKQNLALTFVTVGQIGPGVKMLEEVVRDSENIPDIDDAERDRYRSSLASAYSDAGRTDDAIAIFQQVLATRKQSLGAKHPDVYLVLNNIGAAYLRSGRGADGLKFCEEAYAGFNEANGSDHPMTLASQNNIALCLYETGKFAEAKKLLDEIYATALKKLGPEHPTTLSILNSRSQVVTDLGDSSEGLKQFMEVAETRERVFGPDHPETMNAWSNVANNLLDQGQVDKSLQILERLKTNRERVLGKEHLDTLTTMVNLANAYQVKKRIGEAIALTEFVVESRTKQLGEKNSQTLSAVVNLARMRGTSGDIPGGIAMLEKSRPLLEEVHGKDHPDTLTAMNILGNLYFQSGDTAKGAELFSYVAEGRVRLLGENHPSTALAFNNLARAYEDRGETEKSLAAFERAANSVLGGKGDHDRADIILGNAIRVYDREEQLDKSEKWRRWLLEWLKKRKGGTSQEYRLALAQLGLNLRQQRKWTDVEPVMREIVKLDSELPSNGWYPSANRMLLGSALVELKKFEEAETLLLQARKELRDYIENHTDEAERDQFLRQSAGETSARLVELYKQLDKPDEVKKYEAEALPLDLD